MNKTLDEQLLERDMYELKTNWEVIFWAKGVLKTCERLRHKISVLSRRLQRTRTENKRLRMENQRLIDFYKKYE